MKKLKKWFRKRRQSKDREKMQMAKYLSERIVRQERLKFKNDLFDRILIFVLKLRFALVERYFENRIKKFVKKYKVERPVHGQYRFETYDYILVWKDHLLRRK